VDALECGRRFAGGGLRWRRKYLELTYGQGAYRPYEDIVRAAAEQSGVGLHCADELVRRWDELSPWPETISVLGALAKRTPLGIATNCSIELGRRAAARCGVAFAAVVTAEEAGFHKPRPELYRAVLGKLGTAAERTLFVAGSAADVPGAKGVGMPVYWHNRMGLAPAGDAMPEYTERSLTPLLEIV